MKLYFQLANSFPGEVYFRVSKHLGWGIEEVIKKKFKPGVKFLIMKYSQIVRAELEAYKEIKDKT